MRKLSILFSLFFLATLGTFGQTWTRLQSWGLDLESLVWVNDSVGYAGGENLLIKSTDYGLSWQELPIEFEGRILALEFLDANSGIAVGENSLILKTQDGGASWSSIAITGELKLEDITYNKESTWLVSGSGGFIYKSVNDGVSWQQVENDFSENLKSIQFLNQDTVYSSGENGIILRSYDRGENWERLNSGTSAVLNDINFSSELVGYAVGSGGVTLKTLDGGDTWQNLVTGVTNNLKSLSISKIDPTILVIAGELATVIRSANAGGSFSKINLGTTNTRDLGTITFVRETNQVYAVGKDGYGITSSNGGSTFSQRLAGVRNDFSSVDFKSDRIGFVAGERGEFLVTTNYGQTFISRPIPEELDIAEIYFLNNSTGYISGADGMVYRTNNGGQSWNMLAIETTESIDGIYLFSYSIAYFAGSNGLVSRYSDNSNLWDTEVVKETNNNLKGIIYFDNIEGLAVGDQGTLLYTYGGALWETRTPVTNHNFNGLAKLSSNSALMVGDHGVIVKTSDKGSTFKLIDSGTTVDLLSVDFIGETYGFISGKNGLTLVTKDGGETWDQIESGTSRDLNSISASSASTAYTVGEDGTVLVFECIPAEGTLSEISGVRQSCLAIQKYSVTDGIVPGTQLNWRVDGGDIISGQGSNTIEVNWKDVGRKGVFVDRRNFCGSGETSYIEVIVSDLPSPAEVISGNGIVCESQEEIYQMPELEGVSYVWTVEGGEITMGQGTSNLTVNWSTPGLGAIRVTPENSCGKAETISLPVTINALPEQPSEITGESLVAYGEQVYSIVAEEGISYQWDLNGGGTIISGQGTASIQVAWEEEGDYVLRVKGQNSCDASLERNLAVKVSLITGLEPGPDWEGLKVYPNPSHGRLVVEAEFLDQWNEAIVITSFGQILRQSSIHSGQRRLEFNDLKPGVYYLRLDGHSGTVVRKLLVQ